MSAGEYAVFAAVNFAAAAVIAMVAVKFHHIPFSAIPNATGFVYLALRATNA